IFNFAGVVQTNWTRVHTERRSHRLDGGELRRSTGCVGIAQHGGPGHVRCDLLEQLQPFGANIEFKMRKTGRVAARFSETFDKSGGDGVRDLNEYNGDGMCRPLERPNTHPAAGAQYHVRCECNEFTRILARALGIAPGPTVIDPEIASDGPTELLQRLNKCIKI